ncbi:homeobox protein CDX-2 [Lepisosteus oculatus]|uniref:homeobox protein CDX-2 n=1 Tax=Lepisosteus oculatus TaxID=7918 RepID=UPI0037181317
MHVRHLLDTDANMYPGSVKRAGHYLGAPDFVNPPQYPEYGQYHVSGLNLDGTTQTTTSWHYGPARQDWSAYPQTLQNGLYRLNASPGTAYCPAEYSPGPQSELSIVQALNTNSSECLNANSPYCYQWTNRSTPTANNSSGKTRTRDKYRVVYTDHQRLELEKEFRFSSYITIRRKADIARTLGLSERQVKIWFQNRRAKERKLSRKTMLLRDEAGSVPPGSEGSSPASVAGSTIPNGGELIPAEHLRFHL